MMQVRSADMEHLEIFVVMGMSNKTKSKFGANVGFH
jgi:hypothetical protein